MAEREIKCFIIIPFADEYWYFYLFLKHYIERHYSNIDCFRGDKEYSSRAIIDKINDYIRSADFVIADLTGNNPNVYYELGVAHAHGLPAILIRRNLDNLPFDVQHLPVIAYGSDLAAFPDRIDQALYDVLYRRFDEMYEHGLRYARAFMADTHLSVNLLTKSDFHTVMRNAERYQTSMPDPIRNTEAEIAFFVLFRIIAESGDTQVSEAINRWITDRYGSQ